MVLRRIMDFPIYVIGCSPQAPHPIWSSHGVFSLSLSFYHVRAGGRHWWSDRKEHFEDFFIFGRFYVSCIIDPSNWIILQSPESHLLFNNLLWIKGNRDGLSYDHGHHHQPTKAEKCSFKDHHRWKIIWPFQHMSCMVSFRIFLKQFCDGAKVVIIHSKGLAKCGYKWAMKVKKSTLSFYVFGYLWECYIKIWLIFWFSPAIMILENPKNHPLSTKYSPFKCRIGTWYISRLQWYILLFPTKDLPAKDLGLSG